MNRGPRSFDPRRVGGLECAAWVAYYRRDWLAVMRGAVGLTWHAFGLGPTATVHAAWLVVRANHQWAPTDNDPDAARRTMERLHGLVQVRHGESYDPAVAAGLEVAWWRVHREHQRHGSRLDDRALIEALVALYAYVYGVPEASVRLAAQQRALAMGLSDRWVEEGCDLASSLLGQERAALVRSYAALLAAVHRA